MSTHTAARRTRILQFGVPAAVLGTLSGGVAAAPATADAVPIERPQTTPLRVAPMEAAPASYTVQPGDTVSSIATRFGLRTVDVLSWNGLSWRSVIYPGQTLSLAGSAPAPAAAPSPAPPAAATYVVVAGDTIFGIAQKHGTSVDAVLAANGLTRSSVIFPGQALALSGSPAATAPAPAPAAPAAPAPANGGATHAVVAGDTLFGIAKKHGTTTAALLALNGLGADAIIYPGQSIVVAAAPAPAAPAPAPAAAPGPAAQSSAALDAEQASNAALIIGVGRQLGVSDRAIAIALATAMVESSLRNLPWGDRDSLGLFQQRPSTGWGTPEQALDADRSTRVFFGGVGDPNGQSTRGLLDIPGWETMRFTDAAQAVQISAYPERYGQWETQAYQWLAQHG
ncbi:LysM peptidoglycan-binding domain-containing protein [Microbacterium sp. H83]|uniref:LysM peptidoglycan-binding domain-containing protein n=1 Tax=Microbacterium sp. H83 TaxID=1827324 RepID=UPI0007F34EB4|nr:LysM peptidoglycan-binding domain-containing protein [Microbacterium sp. H83]OAN38496.1 peptidoglycan-binding protein LysM [Microbacterium sp. H83]